MVVTGAFVLVRPPRRERRDAATNRQQVLEAARRLFAERGVEAVTMDEIAQAAGVGKGTLYRRYTDKGQLVLALMDACVGHLADELAADLDTSEANEASALDQLTTVLSRLVDWVEAHTHELSAMSDQAAGARRGATLCGPIYAWMHSVVLKLLEVAVADGETRIDDCVYVADALLANLDIDLYLFQRTHRGYTPAQISAGLSRLVACLRVG